MYFDGKPSIGLLSFSVVILGWDLCIHIFPSFSSWKCWKLWGYVRGGLDYDDDGEPDYMIPAQNWTFCIPGLVKIVAVKEGEFE